MSVTSPTGLSPLKAKTEPGPTPTSQPVQPLQGRRVALQQKEEVGGLDALFSQSASEFSTSIRGLERGERPPALIIEQPAMLDIDHFQSELCMHFSTIITKAQADEKDVYPVLANALVHQVVDDRKGEGYEAYGLAISASLEEHRLDAFCFSEAFEGVIMGYQQKNYHHHLIESRPSYPEEKLHPHHQGRFDRFEEQKENIIRVVKEKFLGACDVTTVCEHD